MPQPRHSHYQALEPDSRKVVSYLAPILRISDALDRGHEQKVRSITSVARDGVINLQIESELDPDLEIWSASEAAETFREIYTQTIALQRAKR